VLAPIVARAFDVFNDGGTWASALAAIGSGTLAGGLFWAITQTIDALIVVSSLRLLLGITQRISAFLQRQGWVKTDGGS